MIKEASLKLVEQAKLLAKRSGMKMYEVNLLSEVPKTTTENWFKGANDPSLGYFRKYLNAMGYDLKIVEIQKDEAQ